MNQIKSLKQAAKHFALRLEHLNSSRQINSLKLGQYYGHPINTLNGFDQLGHPKSELVVEYYGQINDIDAAKRFGTEDLTEYSFWAWRSCGVANVATILKSLNSYKGTLYQLVRAVAENDGYLHEDRFGNKDIGWKHVALRDTFIHFGFSAELFAHTSVYGLLLKIAAGAYAIASVKSRLSDSGSHMVTVYGFTWNGSETKINIFDPFNLDNNGGFAEIELADFEKNFLNKGIVVWG